MVFLWQQKDQQKNLHFIFQKYTQETRVNFQLQSYILVHKHDQEISQLVQLQARVLPKCTSVLFLAKQNSYVRKWNNEFTKKQVALFFGMHTNQYSLRQTIKQWSHTFFSSTTSTQIRGVSSLLLSRHTQIKRKNNVIKLPKSSQTKHERTIARYWISISPKQTFSMNTRL